MNHETHRETGSYPCVEGFLSWVTCQERKREKTNMIHNMQWETGPLPCGGGKFISKTRRPLGTQMCVKGGGGSTHHGPLSCVLVITYQLLMD